MSIQVIGTKKCRDTQKTERYFKERKIAYQFVDLAQRGLSKGELDRIGAVVGLENLVDRTCKEYEKLNLKYMVHNLGEMLLTHPLLLKTPIVRNGPKAVLGYRPEIWQAWE